MQYVTFVIAVTGFILSVYTFITTRLARRPRLAIFRYAPERLVVDDDFNTLHVYTDANFIVTNLSDKPNTVIRLEVSGNFGSGWRAGVVYGTRLAESTRTRTDYGGADGAPRHHNEIVRQWVGADVCPIMLSPQASGIPNQGISLRLDFQNSGPINDPSSVQIRLTLHDQYGARHSFDVGSDELAQLGVTRYPKFFDDEIEIGRLKGRIPSEDMDAVVRVVLRSYQQDLSQSALSVRRYYPLLGGRQPENVSQAGRDGYTYNNYRPRDFQRRLKDEGDGVRVLDEVDGFTISFGVKNGQPQVLTITLPETWMEEQLEIPIPEEFAGLCIVEGSK